MSFNAKEERIYDLFSRKIYAIPRNQRRYVWVKTNWQELFNDILYRESKKDYSHFIGSIVLKKGEIKDGIPTFTIIDGQQRIMTISIFLVSIMYLMKKYDKMDDFDGTKPYVITTNERNKKIVVLDAENNSSYERIVKQLLVETPESLKDKTVSSFLEKSSNSSDKNVIAAFKFFITEIEKYISDDNGKIVFLRNAIRDIEFINITATSEEDSYTIFEILNARGLDLEDHELLKNYIMRYIEPESTRDKAKQEWREIEEKLGNTNLKKFIRHYTIHRYGTQRSKSNKMSDYKIIQKNNERHDTQGLLDDIIKKSEYYLMLAMPSIDGENKNCSELEYKVFNFFKKRRQEQMRPLLLTLITNHKLEQIDDELYEEVITFLFHFYICFNIISKESSNKLTGIINKYSEILSDHYSDELVRNLISDLKKTLPSKLQFIDRFQSIGWSHHDGPYTDAKDKEKVKIILEIFERYKNHGNFQDNMTIEHVLPDSEEIENCQIGNLLPLEDYLNRKCGNMPLEEKLHVYQDSNYKMTRDFAKRYLQNINFNPRERGKFLASEFYDNILHFK